jgi:uncharacterized membrane protein YfbV (UPF0208 family)
LTDINVEWVDEVPERFRATPFDEVAQRVRDTGNVAKITTTQTSVHTLATRLRKRFKDLDVTGRTTADGWFVFIERKGD